MLVTVLWGCMWGRGLIGSNGTFSTLWQFSVTPSATHNQTGPFWCCFPSVWARVCWETLWASLTNSPVRLGVSPAAASTPTGVFNQWFEALFPHAGTLGCMVSLAPQLFLLVYLYSNVGPPSPQATTSLGPLAATLLWVLSALTVVSAPSTGLDECFFFNSLVVGLPYSSIFSQFWLVFVFKFVVVGQQISVVLSHPICGAKWPFLSD